MIVELAVREASKLGFLESETLFKKMNFGSD